MTTITWDGKTLAADSLVTQNDTRVGYFQKIRRWDKGWFSVAGSLKSIVHIQHYLNTGKVTKFKSRKFAVLCWNEELGVMFEAEGDLCFYPASTPTSDLHRPIFQVGCQPISPRCLNLTSTEPSSERASSWRLDNLGANRVLVRASSPHSSRNYPSWTSTAFAFASHDFPNIFCTLGA